MDSVAGANQVTTHRAARFDEFAVRNRYILVADLVLIGVSAFLAFALRFDLGFLSERSEFAAVLALTFAIKTPMFFAFGLYRRYWRYVSLNDMLVIGAAALASSVLLLVVESIVQTAGFIAEASRAVLLIDCLLTFVLVGGLRGGIRLIGESQARARISGHVRANGIGKPPRKRVLIVGAGDAGAMVVREMQRNPQLEMDAIGFLDDDEHKHGHRIYGTLVLGPLSDLDRIAKIGSADEVLIAMPTASGATVRAAVERSQALGLRCRTMPGVFELLGDQVSISRLRKVQITDLLRRKQMTPRLEASSYVTGKTVLVTGAGGSIGSELCRQVAHDKPSLLVMLGHGENSLFEAHARMHDVFPDVAMKIVVADIRDRRRIESVFAEFEPEIVLHAAAHKHVHLMEENFVEAITNNVIGTYYLVEAALKYHAERFVTISTDKAVSPTGIMGASKRLASMIVRGAGRRSGRPFVAVRFGNVLGSRGSVVPYFTEQIAKGGPITITHPDMKRFFMTIPEAVHLVLEAGGMGKGGELFVLNMGEPVRIIDLAQDLIRLSGFAAEQIPIVVSGARLGEKLEEVLWEQGSEVLPTANSDILRVKETEAQAGDVAALVEALQSAVDREDRVAVESILCEWIPGFVPTTKVTKRMAGVVSIASARV